MTRYRVTGVGTITGRPRSYIVGTTTAKHAMQLAYNDCTQVHAIIRIALDLPGGAQIAIAWRYNIAVLDAISQEELGDLTHAWLTYDTAASRKRKFFAIEYGARLNALCGERMPIHRIFVELAKPELELDLARWFAFTVYHDLMGPTTNSLVKNSDEPFQRQQKNLLEMLASGVNDVSTSYKAIMDPYSSIFPVSARYREDCILAPCVHVALAAPGKR